MVEAEKQRANKLSSTNLKASIDSSQLVGAIDAAGEDVRKQKDLLVSRLEKTEEVCTVHDCL